MGRKNGSRLSSNAQKKNARQNNKSKGNFHPGPKKVGYLVLEEGAPYDQFVYYCLKCGADLKIAEEFSCTQNEVQTVHRVPRCADCGSTIGPLSHRILINVEIRPSSLSEDGTGPVEEEFVPIEAMPKRTFQADPDVPCSYAVKLAPNEIRELLIYLVACPLGELSVEIAPLITTVKRSERDRPRYLDMSANLSAFTVLQPPSFDIDLIEIGCKLDEQSQAFTCSFASLLELLTFLDDYGGTLFLKENSDNGLCYPTIVVRGRDIEQPEMVA